VSHWLGTREAAAQLGVTLRALYRLIDEGRLPAYKMGRVIRLQAADVANFSRHGFDNPGEIGGHFRGREDPDAGPSGVREPGRPRPSRPSGTQSLRLPEM
jgi:excisionase family DNA binding protein